ncbi:hypothetical protein [Methylocella sp.]|uniref:hypothetical protein n=1 Tax=Methylocella sp. TaxID=1978226 RepID=UPI0035B4EDC4
MLHHQSQPAPTAPALYAYKGRPKPIEPAKDAPKEAPKDAPKDAPKPAEAPKKG